MISGKNKKSRTNLIYRAACVILTVCLTVLMLSAATKLMERKDSSAKYHDFFEQKQDFDVLFLGTSHVINGVFPMELWEDYGIVSYNFGGHANAIPTTYWTMKNALNYTNPKLIVVDCMGLERNSKRSGNFNFTHLSFDAFPFSLTKLQMAWDIVGIQKEESEEKKPGMMELLWDYCVYHSRWDSLEGNDFNLNPDKSKGAEMNLGWAQPDGIESVPEGECFEDDSVGIDYLEKMIEDCQSKNIEILLTWLPAPGAGVDDITAARRMEKIAKEYGVNCINFLDMDVIDINCDGADSNSHLNPSGARKVTSYLGQYIMENYDISDRRQDPGYSFWNDDYAEYVKEKTMRFIDAKSLKEYLVMMSDPNASSVIYLENAEIIRDEKYKVFLNNIGIDQKKINDDTRFIYVPGDDQEPVYFSNADELYEASHKEYSPVDLEGEEITDPICISVYDNASGDLIHIRGFKK